MEEDVDEDVQEEGEYLCQATDKQGTKSLA